MNRVDWKYMNIQLDYDQFAFVQIWDENKMISRWCHTIKTQYLPSFIKILVERKQREAWWLPKLIWWRLPRMMPKSLAIETQIYCMSSSHLGKRFQAQEELTLNDYKTSTSTEFSALNLQNRPLYLHYSLMLSQLMQLCLWESRGRYTLHQNQTNWTNG